MELTLTRLLLLTVVNVILTVSVVSANPWRIQADRAELQDALDFLKKHLSDKGVKIPEGRQQVKTDDFPVRQMEGGWQQTADTQRIYVPRLNFENQRETVDEGPVEMLINEEVTSDDIESELESNDLNQEDSIFSEGAVVDDLIADIIAKEILDDLENAAVKNDETDNTRGYDYTEGEMPVASFDYDQEIKNYERFLAQKMDKQDGTPYDDNNLDNEITDDILNEVMMTFMENTDDGGQELETNKIINEKGETDELGPLLTQDEEDIIVAENILQEIEDELKREKMEQDNLSKRNQLQAQHFDPSAFCPVLGYLVDDCEIAAIDGIGGDGYRQLFELPCNWHQICYTCGNSYGISQEICDEAFYLEMLSLCGKSQACSNRADFFLLAASEDRIPQMTSLRVCQRKCVRDFLLGLDE